MFGDTAVDEEIKKIYEPDIIIGMIEKSGSLISGVKLIKRTENHNSAVAAVAAYDKNGNLTAVEIAKANPASVGINDEITVPIRLTMPDAAVAYAVMVFDNFTNMKPIAQMREYGTIVTEADGDSIGLKTDLESCVGKKSLVLVSDAEITEDITAAQIKYLHGETVTAGSYRKIPFESQPQGAYYIRTGIDGADTINEKKNTLVNILPDNDGVTETLNTWSFTESLNDDNGKDPFSLTGGASRTDDGRIRMNTTSTGAAEMAYANPVTVSQGGKVTVEFDIYYGRLSSKTMSYTISDSAGSRLVSVSLNAYDPSKNASVTIGGIERLTDYTELSGAVSRSKNTAAENGPTHYKNVFDFGDGKAYITVSSVAGTAEFSGKLDSATANNIKTIKFETSYNNNDRACLVDDVKVVVQSAPQYAITIGAVDNADNTAIDGAVITVADAHSQAEISPNAQGAYMLCEGEYSITAAAAGYRTVTMPFELSPAVESKQIKIPMVSDADLTPASVTIKYLDEEKNSIREDVHITQDLYVGDQYTVPDIYTAEFTVKDSQGKINLYRFNASASETNVILTENTELILVFHLMEQYDYYENFNDYIVDESAWKKNKGGYPVVADGVISYSATSTSLGAYTTFDEISCEGKMVKIKARLKFAPKTITGDSQFSIGDSAPTFSSKNIDYGVENATGHILSLIHKKNNAAFLVNGESVSTAHIGDWVDVEADINFASRKVTVTLTNDNGYNAVVEDVNFYSSSTADHIGSFYLRAAGGNGVVSLDELSVSVTGDAPPAVPEIESVINYKSVYAFGDSIVYGHNDPGNAFVNRLAGKYSMKLSKYAKNGATVIDSSNDILAQINSAPAESPDFIIFDGYTNDAYGPSETDSFNAAGDYADVTKILGTPLGSSASEFESTTFCGAFEEILYTMKQKWPGSKIMFVTIHKSGARDFEVQQNLHDLTVQMCSAWGVNVLDMFSDCTLDTRNADEMAQYIIGGKGSHPNADCCDTYYVPMTAEKLIGLCETE